MKIAITGATGFVGSYITKRLSAKGYTIVALDRGDFAGSTDSLAEKLSGSDAVINLAGAPILSKWTLSYKDILYASRVDLTKNLVAAIKTLAPDDRPTALLSASAIGIYKSGGPHTEESRDFNDAFLGKLAHDWEAAALEAGGLGLRVAIMRFAVVLGADGGALSVMLPPFKLGVGGTIGSGAQPFSWIHIEDLARAMEKLLEDSSCGGIFNLSSPNPITNAIMTRALGRALGRPTLLKVPEIVLHLQYGEGATVLIEGQSVVPSRLLDMGFEFRFSSIDEALSDLIKH